MSEFTKPLTVTKLKNGRWKVSRGFRYYVGKEGGSDFVDVPKGFDTDFASVPQIFWNILPPDGQYTQAAVLHDFLYGVQGNAPEGKHRSRQECDNIFYEAMGILGVPQWKRSVMWIALKFFGFYAWNKSSPS